MSSPPAPIDVSAFVSIVDHTLLKATATYDDVVRLCDEAIELGTAAVCVNSMWVDLVRRRLDTSDVATCSVVGFPLGAMASTALAAEATVAVADGAHEIDMVIPVGPLQAGDDAVVAAHVTAVREAAPSCIVKVILETALLTTEQIARACSIAEAHGADFVKTSTGFDPAGGVTVEAVTLMAASVASTTGVKASGGIRTLADVEAMIAAGATRLGMSATRAVVDEIRTTTRA